MIRFVAGLIAALSCFAGSLFVYAGEPVAVGRAVARNVSGDLTLEKAVRLALQQNPEILKALQEIERTRGQVIEVRAQALPHVTLTGNYNQQDRELFQGSQGGGAGGTANLNSVQTTTPAATGTRFAAA